MDISFLADVHRAILNKANKRRGYTVQKSGQIITMIMSSLEFVNSNAICLI